MPDRLKVFFDDPRLHMTFPGRFLVRISTRIFWLLVIVSTLTFIFLSDVQAVEWLGFFMALFLMDKAWHRNEADKPLSELPASGKTNISQYLEPSAFKVIETAYEKSLFYKNNFHIQILLSLLKFGIIREILLRLEVKPEEFAQKAEQSLEREEIIKDKLLSDIDDLLQLSFLEAVSNGSRFVDVLDIFAAVGRVNDAKVRKLMAIFSLDQDAFSKGAVLGEVLKKIPKWRRVPRTTSSFAFRKERRNRARSINRAWASRPTPTLDRYALDLTDIAKRGHVGFMIGHRKEYNHATSVLSRGVSPNILLWGEPGVGKETVATHLAMNLVHDNVPRELLDKRLVSLDIGLLVSSVSPQDLDVELQKIVREIEAAGNIILHIPDIHNLTRTAGASYVSVAEALRPILTNNAFPVIGSTYPKEYKEFIEPVSVLGNMFEPVQVDEISENEAEKLLIFEGLRLERITGIKVGLAAIKKSVFLAKNYFGGNPLPSSAEELLRAAFAMAAQQQEKFLTPELVLGAAEEKREMLLKQEVGANSRVAMSFKGRELVFKKS